MSDIYAAPAANLELPPDYDPKAGSLERGLAGDYNFTIGEILKEAWARTRGAKLTLNLAAFAYLGIILAVTQLTELAFVSLIEGSAIFAVVALALIQQLIVNAIVMPVLVGLMILGLRRAVDAPISFRQVFAHFHKMLPLLGANVLVFIVMIMGFLLLVVPGIYLSVALMFCLPLVVEKNLGPLAALHASRKAIHKHWFRAAGFLIVLTLINVVAAIPLGIGLFWSVPFTLIAFGVLYNRVFGCSPTTRA